MIVKLWEFDVPPPGVGVNTVTEAVPAAAMSLAGMAAASPVEDTYDVVRSAPFHLTTEPVMKLLPVTVSVNPAPPAVIDVGLMPVVAGTGLLSAVLIVYCTVAVVAVVPTRTRTAPPTAR